MPDLASVEVSQDVKIVLIPIGDIQLNDWNPNELSDVMFNRLVSDINELGFLQPILVTPLEEEGKFRLVDGEHRYECARLLDYQKVPAVILSGEFAKDEMRQKMQTMRMNMIRGTVDKRKLMALVTDLVKKMPIEDVAEGMAFDDVDGLRAMIEDVRATLTPEMKKEFDKAKDEIKTVDDLSLVLNRLFARYGNTLPYNYMILDFGGKEHVWVRLKGKAAYNKVKAAADLCRDNSFTFSSVVLSALSQVTSQYLEQHAEELEEAANGEAEQPIGQEPIGELGQQIVTV
jgi:hypothetical protein